MQRLDTTSRGRLQASSPTSRPRPLLLGDRIGITGFCWGVTIASSCPPVNFHRHAKAACVLWWEHRQRCTDSAAEMLPGLAGPDPVFFWREGLYIPAVASEKIEDRLRTLGKS